MLALALEHPALLGAALLFLLHRLGKRLYTAYLAEEPELFFLPTGLNRACPAELRCVRGTAVKLHGRRVAPPAAASRLLRHRAVAASHSGVSSARADARLLRFVQAFWCTPARTCCLFVRRRGRSDTWRRRWSGEPRSSRRTFCCSPR